MPTSIVCIPLVALIALATSSTLNKTQYIYGATLFFLAAFSYEYQQLRHDLAIQNLAKKTSLCATIIDKEFAENSRYKEWITAQVRDQSALFSTPWKLYIYTMHTTGYIPGDTIEIGNCTMPHKKRNDFSNFLCKEHVATTIFLAKHHTLKLVDRPAWSIRRWLWKKRNQMIDILKNHASKKTLELASCVFWGNKTIIKQGPEIKESFRKIGISHYLARSGLHLIIFMLVWQLILTVACMGHRRKLIFIIILSIGYYMLSWASISFLRALSIFILASIATLTKHRTSILHLLCLMCTIILMYNPMQLFFLDFQLTFGLTFALIWHNTIENTSLATITKSA